MAFNTGDIARVTTKLLGVSDEASQNVWYLEKLAGPGDVASAITGISEWADDAYDFIDTLLSEEVTFDAINILLIDSDEALGDQPWPTMTTGAATGAQQAAGVALLASMKSGISRRVGRKYFGPFSISSFLDDDWPGATVTACLDLLDFADTSFVASNGLTLVARVYDRVAGVARAITGIQAVSNPAYQRRRRRGVGI